MFIDYQRKDLGEGHIDIVVILSPPTSEIGVWFPFRPQVGKLVVAAGYNTET